MGFVPSLSPPIGQRSAMADFQGPCNCGEAGPTGRWYFNSKYFNSRPGNKEIYDSLSSLTDVNWRFERGNNCVGCGVCEKSWQDAIGEKPSRFFPAPAKKMQR